ncbi:MAG: PorT family protein [Prevotellaceae bacterium]|jgi:hypothetical protein|nr:PorT family protein [Prevotellaceae bacterium]
MKKATIFLMLCVSINIAAQNSKWQIGATVSPDFSYRTLSTSYDFGGLFDSDYGKLSYTAGVNAVYNFSELFGLEAGISFADFGYKMKVSVRESIDGPIYSSTMRYSNYYIGIPIKANFSFGKNKFSYIASVGFFTAFLIDEKQVCTIPEINERYVSTIKQRDGESGFLSNYNRINIFPTVGFGVKYDLSDKFTLRAMPTFRFGAIKIYQQSLIKKYLWNVGLEVGFFYNL